MKRCRWKSFFENPKSAIQNPKLVGIVVLVSTLAMCGVEVWAQQPKNVSKMGYLSTIDPSRELIRAEAIRVGLRELGYIEGQNISIEYRYGEGKLDRYAALAAELVHLKVDLIVVTGGSAMIRAAKNATKMIPIVLAGAAIDPVEAGLVESLARPGGNVTGLTLINRELGGKRLELLKETVPKLANVAVIYAPATPGTVFDVREVLPVAARGLGLTIRSWEVRNADEFQSVFAAMSKERPDGLYMPPGALMSTNQKRIIKFALESRLPSMFPYREAVNAGGLMYYGADEANSYRRVAYFVDKILKGTRPGDLPIEQPTKFEMALNLKTAKQIGLTIPPNVLARADRVIR